MQKDINLSTKQTNKQKQLANSDQEKFKFFAIEQIYCWLDKK